MIALYDETEDQHEKAVQCFDLYIEKRPMNSVLLPWPVMYETLSTHMARAARRMTEINRHLRSLRTRGVLHFVDDGEFRERAMEACFAGSSKRPLSLIDCVVRELLSEKRLQTSAFATFNVSDFYDVCRKFRKKIIPES
jgi:predicted nucleic acid-binding protein